jgi:signal transduction histidine kinase
MLRPLGLQDRILAWYGGTVLAVLGLILLLVHLQVSKETREHVNTQMAATDRVVSSLQRERTATLAMVASLAGKEPRLAAAMAGDPQTGRQVSKETISDMLSLDLLHDFDADFMRVTDTHGLVRWDTRGRASPADDLSHEEDVRTAIAGKVWPGMLVLPGEIDLVATAPIHVGHQDLGTVTLGRVVTDWMAEQLHHDTGSHVTFFAGRQLAASSWPLPVRTELLHKVQSVGGGTIASGQRRSFPMRLARQRLMCLLVPIHGENGSRGMLLIQGDLDAAQRPYTHIQRALAAVGLLGLLFAIAGSVIVAGGITRPLHRIAHVAHGLMQGDWSQRAPVTARDEVGLLAETFNRMAERLESWDSDLRAAVAERTRELNTVVAQLDAAYQKMRQFNADASHELRTPLTVIRGEAEVALRAARTGAEYQEALRTIQEETERMSRIVEQLLLLARVDSGELRLERRPVALDDLVRDVTHRAEVLAQARQIRLRAEALEPLLIPGDEDQLGRLTLNLIDNAIKYTTEGGEVRVRLSCAPAGVGSPERVALLQVIDSGIGICPTDIDQIFDRFYRVDKARSRSQGGSGLGLAICRWIVEAHGGRIDVQSQPGLGSTFSVRLPGAIIPALELSDLAESRD